MKKQLHKKLHEKLVTLLFNAKAGHIGSSLSCLDILTELMVYTMKKEDKFILSKGHAVPALYVILHHLKKITTEELATFHKDGTKLPAHPSSYHLENDIPFATGSLGHGLSLASGIAQSYKYFIKGKNKNIVYCLISDGECNEGQVWEAAQYASHFQLSNLIVLLDKNKFQAFGRIENVLGDSATREKWEAFGFEVLESDGHRIDDIQSSLKNALTSQSGKPKIIIFDTVKGHGISFMENTLASHYDVLTPAQYNEALGDLNKL